ncbi:MmgE/PrpD family protein [Pseudomonas sp. NPDC007930]|uniref:MmgE/PrpD family protein n=1 Tax=Pseudomonas sp. NPDC007930 TaxID=3364417 RepID=UPI0036ED0E6A
MTLTAQLVRFAAHLRRDALPAAIEHKLRLHLLDAIGCGWAASGTALARQAHELARLAGGQGECLVFGSPAGYSAAAAAFANAFIINALDHDDGVEIDGKGLGHPGATLIAAAMAALDQHPGGVGEDDLIAALAAGFEINNRLILALQPSAERFSQAYGVGQHQAIGAAVVYGRARGFDEDTLHRAVGFAATLTSVPSLHKYNWQTRPIAALKDGVAPAAQAGVQAALMAQLGLAGSREVFDGPQGYWRMVGSDRFASEHLLDGLGQDWFIRFGSFKRYPACRWLATALECTEALVQRSGWGAADIAHIEVQTFGRLAEDFMVYRPATATDAQFSLPYTVAAAALGLRPGAPWYAGATLTSPAVLALAAKVSVTVDPGFDERFRGVGRQPGARVILVNRAGECLQQAQNTPQGSAARPLEDAAVLHKARLNLNGQVPGPSGLIERLMGQPGSPAHYANAQAWVQ